MLFAASGTSTWPQLEALALRMSYHSLFVPVHTVVQDELSRPSYVIKSSNTRICIHYTTAHEALPGSQSVSSRRQVYEDTALKVVTRNTSPELKETDETNGQLLEADALFDWAKWEHDSTPESSSSGGQSPPSVRLTEASSASASGSPPGTAPACLPPQPADGPSREPPASSIYRRAAQGWPEAQEGGFSSPAHLRNGSAQRIAPQAKPTHRKRSEVTCTYTSEDGQKCGEHAVAEHLWDHVRQAHGFQDLVQPESAPHTVQCSWDGCAFRAMKEEVVEHWWEVHHGSLADDKDDQAQGIVLAAKQVRCRSSANHGDRRAFMQQSQLLRHLRDTHWEFGTWCDCCGKRRRDDTLGKGARDHRKTCLERFMRNNHFEDPERR
ncbi:hypothetical protein EVJ58_g2423 [Rhodofomes roseus]|uniref:C2H2-type domain-containing protein n=1 Tax=Rhodofomes roseus TaxID=34475 RepID=A0A4Y9YQP4_9APHY|nr:hypothetical protein EVJ58_g2423 [Rhodofomes roseus]